MSSDSRPPRKFRSSSSQYPFGTRSLVDGLDDPKIKALKETDPAAYEYYLKFCESEAGIEPGLIYSKDEDKQRCFRDAQRLKRDAMSHADYGVDLTDIPMPDDAEELIANAIDYQSAIHRLDTGVLVSALKAAVKDGRLDDYLIDLRRADTDAYKWTIEWVQSEREKAAKKVAAKKDRKSFKRRHSNLSPEELRAERKLQKDRDYQRKRRKLAKSASE